MLLACRQLHKAYGIDVILEKITFHIEEREKAAIVGVNGAGKTTLFKVLTGEISADGGEFYLKKDASLGYLAQNIQIDSDRTIYEEMLSVFEKIIQTETNLRELENEMGNLSGQALAEKMEEYATLQHYFEQNFCSLRFFGIEVKRKCGVTTVERGKLTLFICKLYNIAVGRFQHPENGILVVAEETVYGNRRFSSITEHQLLVKPPVNFFCLFSVHLACA